MKKKKEQKNIKEKTVPEKTSWQHKIVEYLSYFLIVFIPLCFSGTHMYVFNTPKIIAILSIVLLMTIFKLWGDWNSNLKIRISFLGCFISFFIFALTLSSILGIDTLNSFFGWRADLTPLISIYALTVFSFIEAFLIRRDKTVVKRLLTFSFLTSILVMLVFYLNFSAIDMKDGSTLGNSSYLGAYLLFNIFFGLGLLLSSKKINKIWFALGISFLIINPLFFNLKNIGSIFHDPLSLLGIANGALLGILISSISTVFLFMIFSKKKYLKISGLVFMGLFVLTILIIGKQLSTPDTQIRRVFTETKTSNRFLVWNIAEKGFREKPALGNGFNNYIYTFDRHFDKDIFEDEYNVERFFKPHNIFWELLSENGLLGLLAYVGLMVSLLIVFLNRKEEKPFYLTLSGLLIGYFIQNLFVFDSVTTYLMFFIIVAIGLGVFDSFEREFKIKKRYFSLLGITLATYLFYPLVLAPLLESRSMMKVAINERTGDLLGVGEKQQNLSIFSGVMDDTYRINELLKTYQKKLYTVEGKDKEIYLKQIKSLYSHLENSIKKQPNYSESYLLASEILNLYMMAEMKDGNKFVFEGNNYDEDLWQESFGNINKSLNLNSNNPKSYIILSQLFMIKADMNEAFRYIRELIILAPKYQDSYSFGRVLLRVKPDPDFEKFINDMENKYIKSEKK